jgi:hypothetical protein
MVSIKRHMKNTDLAALLLISFLTPGAWANPTLSLGIGAGNPGANVTLPVSFNPGGSQIAAVQFSLKLPSTLSPVTVTAGPAASSAGKSVTAKLKDGQWNIIVFGLNQTPIGTGDLVTATVRIAPKTTTGILNVPINHLVFADPSGMSKTSGAGHGGSVNVVKKGTPEISQ